MKETNETKKMGVIQKQKEINEANGTIEAKKAKTIFFIREKIVSIINKVINIINKLKEIREKKETKNQNELARNMQNKTAYWVMAGLAAFIFAGWFFMHSKGTSTSTEISKKPDAKQESAKLAGTVDPQFDQESSKKALEEQRSEIKDLNEKLAGVNEKLNSLQNSLDIKKQEENNNNNIAVRELQNRVIELEAALKRSGSHTTNTNSGAGTRTSEAEPSTKGITTTSFSFFSSSSSASSFSSGDEQTAPITGALKNATSGISTTKAKTAKNYVPPGTFAKAVLLNGADTNAGVHGQSDTTPIVMRILDNGTLPNGNRSSLKGCFVTAAAYGDASSERGQIRLQRLSCLRPGDHILDIPIEGTINDMGGNDGIRGHIVMRNQKLIWNAGISGFLSGIGNAMQQSATTQAISPLGITSTIKSGKVFEHSAYGGANTALGKLADYYIKLADMYHPIVQVHAGSQVNIVFLKGFSLNEGIPEEIPYQNDTKVETTSFQKADVQNSTQTIKHAHLGESVSEQNNIEEAQ